MIVECPRCSARYRVEDEVLKEDPTFKCSRCGNLFGYEGAAEAAPPPSRNAAPARERPNLENLRSPAVDEGPAEPPSIDQAVSEGVSPPAITPATSPPAEPLVKQATPESMSFSFDEPSEVDSSPRRKPGSSLSETEPEEARPDLSARPIESEEPDLSFHDDDDDDLPVAADDDELADEPDDPRFLREEDPFRSEEDQPARNPLRPYLVFLGLLLLFYGNVALYLRNHADAAEQTLSSIPLAGRFLAENRLLQTRIYLKDLAGAYQTIKDGRQVFIVSGRALNTADRPVRSVEIESALYDASGKSVATKTIFCGNIMSLKIVKDLSSQEISLLQRLRPPVRFEIPSDDETGFSVVFLDPPSGLEEFSARVVSAQSSDV